MKRLLLAILILTSATVARAQTPAAGGGEVVDRMVAVVNGAELITYSDLLWQLALQPGAPLDNPRREDLRRALELLIDQRLVAQEAEKLPHVHATEQEMKDAEAALIKRFPSHEEFQRRLERVGMTRRAATRDHPRAHRHGEVSRLPLPLLHRRHAAGGRGVLPDVFVPRRRRQSPGAIVPELKAIYEQMQTELIERKIESDTDAFLEDARAAAQITFLDESLADGGGRRGAAARARPRAACVHALATEARRNPRPSPRVLTSGRRTFKAPTETFMWRKSDSKSGGRGSGSRSRAARRAGWRTSAC